MSVCWTQLSTVLVCVPFPYLKCLLPLGPLTSPKHVLLCAHPIGSSPLLSLLISVYLCMSEFLWFGLLSSFLLSCSCFGLQQASCLQQPMVDMLYVSSCKINYIYHWPPLTSTLRAKEFLKHQLFKGPWSPHTSTTPITGFSRSEYASLCMPTRQDFFPLLS